jgi:hypothetical protein
VASARLAIGGQTRAATAATLPGQPPLKTRHSNGSRHPSGFETSNLDGTFSASVRTGWTGNVFGLVACTAPVEPPVVCADISSPIEISDGAPPRALQ